VAYYPPLSCNIKIISTSPFISACDTRWLLAAYKKNKVAHQVRRRIMAKWIARIGFFLLIPAGQRRETTAAGIQAYILIKYPLPIRVTIVCFRSPDIHLQRHGPEIAN